MGSDDHMRAPDKIEAEIEKKINEIVGQRGFVGGWDNPDGKSGYLSYIRPALEGLPLLGLYINKKGEDYRVIIGVRPPDRNYAYDKKNIPFSNLGGVLDSYIKFASLGCNQESSHD